MLVVRTDLKMSKGKIAAQCGHATLARLLHSAGVASPRARQSVAEHRKRFGARKRPARFSVATPEAQPALYVWLYRLGCYKRAQKNALKRWENHGQASLPSHTRPT